MKITLVYLGDFDFPLTEGVRKQVFWHAKLMKKQGHSVEIRYLGKKRNYTIDGIKFFSGNAWRISKLSTNILHFFNAPNPLMIPFLLQAEYEKIFLSIYDGELSVFWTSKPSYISYKLLKNKISAVFVQTMYQARKSKKFFSKTRILPPLMPQMKQSAQKTKHPSILFMSQFSSYKGIELLIKSFLNISEKYKDAELILANNKLDKTNSIARKIRNLKNPRIKIKGVVDPQEELSKCWIYAYPITKAHDTFSVPLSLYESVQTKTPFIATNVGGISEYFDKAYLIKPTVMELTKRIGFLIKNRKKPNLPRMKKKFSNSSVIAKTLEAYNEN